MAIFYIHPQQTEYCSHTSAAFMTQQTKTVSIDVVVGFDVLQEVKPDAEMPCHQWFNAKIVAEAVLYHAQCISGFALTQAVAFHEGGSFGIAALSHQHFVDERYTVERRCCSGEDYIIKSLRIYVGALLASRYMLHKLTVEQLAMPCHRGIEESYQVAVGSPMIVRHVTTSISEGHRTAHAHHILTDVKHLSFQFCGHPQVVLVTYGYVPPPALAMALKKFPLIPSLVSLLYMRNAIPLGAFLA